MVDIQEQTTHEWVETDNELALRAHIFQTDDREELLIEVPEWRAKLLIKALTGTARAEFISFQIALSQQHKDTAEYWRRVWFELTRLGCLHPRTRKPIFQIADRDTLLNEKNGAVLQMLGQTVQEFSRLDGSVPEQVRKNLSSIPNSITTTPLLNGSASNE